MPMSPVGSPLRRLIATTCLLLLAGCQVPERFIFTTDTYLDFTALGPDLPIEEIIFPDEDRRLYGWYVPGEPERPLIIYFQGTASNVSHRIENLRRLREELGLSIFIFDYRGFGWSLGDPSVAGLFEDARIALAQMENEGWPPREIIYYGHSLGAAIALQLALERPPAGLVLEAPFTSLKKLVRYHKPWSNLWFSLVFPDYYNNLKKIAQIRTPLLLLHGDCDPVSPPAMSHELYARASPPKRLHIIAGGDHDGSFRSGNPYWHSWRQFLAQIGTASGKSRPAALPGPMKIMSVSEYLQIYKTVESH
jgi:uncharacterized protein